MDDMMMKARGESLKGLMGAMEEDDARSIPAVTLRISTNQDGGIEIEQTGGESVEGKPDGHEMHMAEEPGEEHPTEGPGTDVGVGGPGDAFEELLERKKKEKMGR